MQAAVIHDFQTDANIARRRSPEVIERHLSSLYPGARLTQGTLDEDRDGIDFWVDWRLGRFSIDVKYRERDCRNFGLDDACLELDGGNGPGWTLDPSKKTEVVVWAWMDTGRAYSALYAPLRDTFIAYANEWSRRFGIKEQVNRNAGSQYVTQWVAVPIDVLETAMAPYLQMRGGIQLYEDAAFCRVPDCCQSAFYPCDEAAYCGQHYEKLRDWRESDLMKHRRLQLEAAASAASSAKYDAISEKTEARRNKRKNNDDFASIMTKKG